ncbi:MAG: flagellar hook-length control protein FliK [Proteobacteria bacterium]|nr:flagellar hook-length control protein FliK [Pseudomonadota bacterium]MBU6425447.1 flagellar hook-length control protein FliK [Rhodospirillales bacterium]
MPVSAPISITQSTGLAANTATAPDHAAWQEALTNSDAAPQPGTPPSANNTAKPQQQTAAKMPPDPTQTASAETASRTKAEPTPKGAKPQPSIAASGPVLADDKKNTPKAVPVAGLAVPVQPAMEKPANASHANAPVQTAHIAPRTQAVTADSTSSTAPTMASTAPATTSTSPAQADTAMPATTKQSDTTPNPAATKTTPASETLATQTPRTPPAAPTPPVAAEATPASATAADTQLDTRTAKATPQPTASAPTAPSTAQALTARVAQLPAATEVTPTSKEKTSAQQLPAFGSISPAPEIHAATASGSTVTETGVVTANASIGPAALAATVTALHQSGQSGTVLRLDPPGLGHLSVQVRFSTQGQVNVLFVPSTADAAQAIQASLPGLGAAMAQSGLSLGQAQVGGQFPQQSGQNSQSGYSPPRQNNAAAFATEPQATPSGLSAYA